MTRKFQISCYGCTVEDLRASVVFANLSDPIQVNSIAMGTLSDAQERISMGLATDEDTRQAMNRAKYFISESSRLIREKAQKPTKELEVPSKPESLFKTPVLFWCNCCNWVVWEKRGKQRHYPEFDGEPMDLVVRKECYKCEVARCPGCNTKLTVESWCGDAIFYRNCSCGAMT